MSNINAKVVETCDDGSEHWYDAEIISETKKHYLVKFCSDCERTMFFVCKTLVATHNPKAYRLILQESTKIISEFKQIEQNWQALSFLLNPAHSEVDYQRQVTMLDALIDEIGEDEKHPLAGLMENLGMLIHSYETEHYPIPVASARDILKS